MYARDKGAPWASTTWGCSLTHSLKKYSGSGTAGDTAWTSSPGARRGNTPNTLLSCSASETRHHFLFTQVWISQSEIPEAIGSVMPSLHLSVSPPDCKGATGKHPTMVASVFSSPPLNPCHACFANVCTLNKEIEFYWTYNVANLRKMILAAKIPWKIMLHILGKCLSVRFSRWLWWNGKDQRSGIYGFNIFSHLFFCLPCFSKSRSTI